MSAASMDACGDVSALGCGKVVFRSNVIRH